MIMSVYNELAVAGKAEGSPVTDEGRG